MEIVLALLVIVFLFITPAGQYQMQTLSPSSEARIAISPFVNKTFKEDLDEVLMAEVARQFMLRTNLQMVKEEEAEFLLRGEILQYIREPGQGQVSPTGEYKITIEVDAQFISVKEGIVVWKQRFGESATYSIFETASIQTEQEAIKEVSRKISEDIVDVTLNGWGE
ncbi:hypothetical protein IBX65_09545 [Candidatus Aerophobetes bacterium]|nr:hypothetical protein [Candidatus Aerophobetes bacterium]